MPLRFAFRQPLPVADGVALGHLIDAGDRDVGIVRITDERLVADGQRVLLATAIADMPMPDEPILIDLVWRASCDVLHAAFGERWQSAFESVFGLEARYLREDRFSQSLLAPFAMRGIAEIAYLSESYPPAHVGAGLRGVATAAEALRRAGRDADEIASVPLRECIKIYGFISRRGDR